MRGSLAALMLLLVSACNRTANGDAGTENPSGRGRETAESSDDLTHMPARKMVEPTNVPEVAEAFGVLLEAKLPGLTDASDDEVAARKQKRRPPPAPLEWKILPANVISNYYLLEPSTGPITWRGIVIGYRKREVLLDGTIIETWYQDSALTSPLQGVRIVTTSATDKDGTRQIKASMSNDAWEAQYVVSVPKNGPAEAIGSTTADGKTTTVTVKQNAPGAAKPFHVHYTDSNGQSADIDVSPKVRKPSPQPPATPSPVPPPAPAPAPAPASNKDGAARAAEEAKRARKALESAQRAREQIEQLRRTQEAIRQVEAARKAAEQVEAARKAAEQAEAARKAVEQAEAARRAAEQAEAARKAAEAATQPRVPIIPH